MRVVISICLVLFSISFATQPIGTGDYDGSRRLSKSDRDAFVEDLLDPCYVPASQGAGDMNGDGRIDGQDIQRFVNLIVEATDIPPLALVHYGKVGVSFQVRFISPLFAKAGANVRSSVLSVKMPPGVAMNGADLMGTPTVPGTYSVCVLFFDSTGKFRQTQQICLVIVVVP